jgi:DNA-binding MarR family transcriptional regulator
LKATKRLSAYRRRDGLTDLVPQNRDDVEFGAMKSAKCDRGFYKRRAELIDRVLFNRELTPGQRLVMLGIAAMTDPDTRQCDAGQTYLATALNVNRNTVITAMPKLAAEGYVLRAASDSGRREILTVTAPELAAA